MTKQRLLGLMMSFCFAMFTFAQSGNGERPILKGYKGSVELGFAAGAGDAGHNRMEVLMVNGYQFNRWLSAGIGTGIQVWQVTQQVTLPLFADFEATFMQKTIAPYANLRLGYCFGLTYDDVIPKDGVYFSPTVGFRWGVGRNTAWKLGVGYWVQGSDIKQNYGTPNEFTERIFFHSLVAKLAFEF